MIHNFEDGFSSPRENRNKLLNFDEINCFVCIDSDENVIARETWNRHAFIKDEDFDRKLTEIKKKSKGMFATILDIHN